MASGEDNGPSTGIERASIEDVIADAEELHAWFKKELGLRNFNPLDSSSVTEILTAASKHKYRNLVDTYPLLSRDMAATGTFDKRILGDYFRWVSTVPAWMSDEERVRMQAKYMYYKAFYAAKDAKLSLRDSREYAEKEYAKAEKTLLDEEKEIKQLVSEAQKRHAKRMATAREETIEELRQILSGRI